MDHRTSYHYIWCLIYPKKNFCRCFRSGWVHRRKLLAIAGAELQSRCLSCCIQAI